MSDKVYFMNNGSFDVRAMLTFGVSAKENDNAIGYFGTGFKYAVAIILRMGGNITVESNGETNVFTARKKTIRGQEFSIVYCNDREAGFTTRLGINWEPWMAFRELYCNAKDECGEIAAEPKDFDTVITIKCHEIYSAFMSRDAYFISGVPVATSESVEIYDKPSQFIYCCGVAVKQIADAQFTYNLTQRIDLTEDRTAKWEHQIRYPLQRSWQLLKDASIIRRIIAPIESYENATGFDTDWPTSDEFTDTAVQMLKTTGVSEAARTHVSKLDEKAGNWPTFELTKTQSIMLVKAKDFLLSIQVNVDDFDIRTVSGLGNGVMGRALDGVIYLSDMPFQMGTKQLASTLLEEWVHNKYGCADFDRNMQTWLFDKVLSIGEEMIGEPI